MGSILQNGKGPVIASGPMAGTVLIPLGLLVEAPGCWGQPDPAEAPDGANSVSKL
jgi:hypothetical protein